MRDSYDHQRRSLGPLFEDRATEVAIARVEEANTPSPLDVAEADAIKTLAGLPEYVTSDMILPDLAVYGFTDNRAMGPLMRRLISGGHITGTESFRLTKRIGSNRMPRPVYRNEKWQGF